MRKFWLVGLLSLFLATPVFAKGVLVKSDGTFSGKAIFLDFGPNFTVDCSTTPGTCDVINDDQTSLTSAAANPATTGVVRMGNNERVCWRNVANTADVCIYVDSTFDWFTFEDDLNMNTFSILGATSLRASGDVGDAGFIRIGNAGLISWEASPAGTDLTLTTDVNEVLVASHASMTVGGNTVLTSTHDVANEHIDHSGVSITAGTGLTGGGDITLTRNIDCDAAVADGATLGCAGFVAADFTAASGVISIAAAIARDSELHNAVTLSGSGTYLVLGTQDIQVDLIDENDVISTATLAGNPDYGADSVWFATTGLIFEGLTAGADANEGLLKAADVSADVTWTLPNETGTLCTTGSICTGYLASTHAGGNSHIDWTAASAGTIHATNYVDNGEANTGQSLGIGTPVYDSTVAGVLRFNSLDSNDFTTPASNVISIIDSKWARDAELHNAITMSGTPTYITLSGQDIVRGLITLTTDVTGRLPLANFTDDDGTAGLCLLSGGSVGELNWGTCPTSGAPTDADYLVGTANGSLSAEIVVGTSPGGELGGTWASPTVDSVHSGSAHHTIFSPNADPGIDHSNYVAGGAGTDTTAIHDDTASEISAVTLKGTPVSADMLLIEDSAAANAKKRITIGSLPGGSETNTLETDVPPNILDTEFFVGTGPGTGAWVAMTGDVTMSNAGVTAIQANTVGVTELNDTECTTGQIYKKGASNWACDTDATGGGGSQETMRLFSIAQNISQDPGAGCSNPLDVVTWQESGGGDYEAPVGTCITVATGGGGVAINASGCAGWYRLTLHCNVDMEVTHRGYFGYYGELTYGAETMKANTFRKYDQGRADNTPVPYSISTSDVITWHNVGTGGSNFVYKFRQDCDGNFSNSTGSNGLDIAVGACALLVEKM